MNHASIIFEVSSLVYVSRVSLPFTKMCDSTINSAQVTYNFVPTVDGVHLSGLEFDTRV